MGPEKTLFAITQRALRIVESTFDDALAPLGIDAMDFETLHAIAKERRWSIVSAARSMRSNRAAISKRIARLEARGLVVVDRRNQRRSRTSLTDVGREVLAEAIHPHAEVQAELVLRLGDGTVHALELLAARPVEPRRAVVHRAVSL